MRVKEVEEKIGIKSKNIRFYEKQGLLWPKRNSENGYREFSDQDIKRLKEIKLFRKLGISIEDIRLLQLKEIELKDMLEKQILNFEDEINNFNKLKDLCVSMREENISLKEMDSDSWIFKMERLEEKGVIFMDTNNDEIIRFLPEKFKMQYYKAIIKNGQIDNTLLGEIISYFEDIYKKAVDTEKLLIDVLKSVDFKDRDKLLILIKENDSELHDKISKNIFDFEDIVTLDIALTKNILEEFNSEIIVKASMAASPKVNEYLKKLFPTIDFVKERQVMGSIPINEVIDIHNKIIEAINRRI